MGSALKHTIGKKVMWLIIEKHAFLAETYAKIAKDVMRCEHAVGDIIRAWKRDEGLDKLVKALPPACHALTLLLLISVMRNDTALGTVWHGLTRYPILSLIHI